DHLESLYASRRGGERKCSVVGRPDHPDLAGGPAGLHFFVAGLGCVAFRATAEPVDHSLRRHALGRIADRGTSLRQTGAWRLGMHDREATRHPLIDQVVGDPGAHRFEWNLGLMLALRWRRTYFLLDVPEVLS